MIHAIHTDLDLASRISYKTGRAYGEAVEFSRALPSYALVRYRDLLDYLCNQIADRCQVACLQFSLFEKINALADAGTITFGFKDRCHQLRKLCNPGAHRESVTSADDRLKAFQEEHARLRQHALDARELAIWIMDAWYRMANGVDGVLDYTRADIVTQEWKEVLFAATTSTDPDDKYKAGLWCEAEAERREFECKDFIAPTRFAVELDFLKRLAATFYAASHQIKPSVDVGFRYAQFVVQEKIDGDKRAEARTLIEQAAQSGHGEACDYHASILYDEKQDYEQAEHFWLMAAQHNVTRAYSCLWFFYTQGKGCVPQPEKALAFVEQGVEQDCRDCLYTLGRAYFDAEHIARDVDKARQLLSRAADLGHGIARGYLELVVNGKMNDIARELQLVGWMLSSMAPSSQRAFQAADPYAVCDCGSGKKHKWCCMKKKSVDIPTRSPLAHYLPPI